MHKLCITTGVVENWRYILIHMLYIISFLPYIIKWVMVVKGALCRKTNIFLPFIWNHIKINLFTDVFLLIRRFINLTDQQLDIYAIFVYMALHPLITLKYFSKLAKRLHLNIYYNIWFFLETAPSRGAKMPPALA